MHADGENSPESASAIHSFHTPLSYLCPRAAMIITGSPNFSRIRASYVSRSNAVSSTSEPSGLTPARYGNPSSVVIARLDIFPTTCSCSSLFPRSWLVMSLDETNLRYLVAEILVKLTLREKSFSLHSRMVISRDMI